MQSSPHGLIQIANMSRGCQKATLEFRSRWDLCLPESEAQKSEGQPLAVPARSVKHFGARSLAARQCGVAIPCGRAGSGPQAPRRFHLPFARKIAALSSPPKMKIEATI
jgi:hypothetical protein